MLCDRNRPFAEIRPLALTEDGKRPFGLARGEFDVPDDFDAPVAETEALFSGQE